MGVLVMIDQFLYDYFNTSKNKAVSWNHFVFKEDSWFAACKICDLSVLRRGKTKTYNRTNLIIHLTAKHCTVNTKRREEESLQKGKETSSECSSAGNSLFL